MSVSGIEAIGAGMEAFTPFTPMTLSADQVTVGASAPGAVPGVSAVSEPTGPNTDFAQLVTGGVEKLEALTDNADRLAVAAATGDLANIHDYTIAATEASVATQLTTALRNKALEAFNEIMRIPI